MEENSRGRQPPLQVVREFVGSRLEKQIRVHTYQLAVPVICQRTDAVPSSEPVQRPVRDSFLMPTDRQRSLNMMISKESKQQVIRAAIYARVSSDQQTQQGGTIDSQVAALRQRVQADGLVLEEELCFVEDGYSGSTLVRPALERLRDIAWSGGFQRLYVHSPMLWHVNCDASSFNAGFCPANSNAPIA
jgi:Resolvase, N terminal domain